MPIHPAGRGGIGRAVNKVCIAALRKSFMGSILFSTMLPVVGFARSRADKINFGAARGLTFYSSPEIETFNGRLGNSPRLTANHEFGRAVTHSATFEFLNPMETLGWGFEGQLWAETLRGTPTSSDEEVKSEATLAFTRLWLTGGVRLWPWVGPAFARRPSSMLGFTVVRNKARKLESGVFSHLRFATGPLLWRHDYLLSDSPNQTLISYASRSLAWDGAVRWTLGYRLGSFCDLGVDVAASRSLALKTEAAVGQYFLSGRDYNDQPENLEVGKLSKSAWRTSQALVFIRFFHP